MFGVDPAAAVALALVAVGVAAIVLDAARPRSTRVAVARLGFALVVVGWLGVAATVSARFAATDLRLVDVARFSRAEDPTWLRWSSSWAGPGGSLVLWVTIVVVALAAVAVGDDRATGRRLVALVGATGTVAVVASGALSWRPDAPIRGGGLVPVLEHPLLAIHPPLLYAAQAAALAAALAGWPASGIPARERHVVGARRDETARRWSAVTLALAVAASLLGAWWAHDELGWGGWWAWDPVENTALVPLVGAVAALHARRPPAAQRWRSATAAMVLGGVALTRSGVPDSVHAFSGGGVAAWVAALAASSIVLAEARRATAVGRALSTAAPDAVDEPVGRADDPGGPVPPGAAALVSLAAGWVAVVVVAASVVVFALGLTTPRGTLYGGTVARIVVPAGVVAAVGILRYGIATGRPPRPRRAAVLVAHVGALMLAVGAVACTRSSVATGWVDVGGSRSLGGTVVRVRSVETRDAGDRVVVRVVVDVGGRRVVPELVRHLDLDVTRARPAIAYRGSVEEQVTATAVAGGGARLSLRRDPGILWVWLGGGAIVVGAVVAPLGQAPSRRRRFASSSEPIDAPPSGGPASGVAAEAVRRAGSGDAAGGPRRIGS